MSYHPSIGGILFGLTLAVFLGPAFFNLIRISIQKGFFLGICFVLGVSMSDMTLVGLSYLGISKIVTDSSNNQLILGMIGGCILILFGLFTLKRKIRLSDMRSHEIKIKASGVLKYIVQGYGLNISNPFIWIFWISVMSLVTSNYVNDQKSIFLFFTGALGTTLSMDLLKSYLANKIKRLIKPRTMMWLNRIVGFMLILFGIALIIRVLYEYFYPN